MNYYSIRLEDKKSSSSSPKSKLFTSFNPDSKSGEISRSREAVVEHKGYLQHPRLQIGIANENLHRRVAQYNPSEGQ